MDNLGANVSVVNEIVRQILFFAQRNVTLMNSLTTNSSFVNDTMQQILSLEKRNLILKINCVPLLFEALIGLPTNILNMLTFRKMGLYSTINISFFFLSIIDLVCECLYTFTALAFMEMSELIDLILGMIIFQIASVTVCLTQMKFTMKPSPGDHWRKIVLDRSKIDKFLIAALVFGASSSITFICFIVIVASTVFLSIVLRQREKWLHSLPASLKEIARRNRRLIHIVVGISTIFITCFMPGFLYILTSFVNPALHPLDPRGQNLLYVLGSYVTLFQALSGTINIFVYFRVNSSFRACLRELLCLGSPEISTWTIQTRVPGCQYQATDTLV